MTDRFSQLPRSRQDWVRQALERFETPLLRYSQSLLGDRERARDVVQEAFLRLCAQDPAVVDPCLRQWLFTVCRNAALDVIRKEKRVKTLDEPHALHAPASEPGNALLASESLDRVKRALQNLPASQQEVVQLRFHAGLSYAEISEVTGHSTSNVGYLLHVALKAVRAQLKEAAPLEG